MYELDPTDRRLMKALRANSRASVTALAAELGVSRVTVQTRLDRLVRLEIIRRFTIDSSEEETGELVKAVMFVALQGAMTRRVIRIMNDLPEVTSLHTTNGTWDLVAHIEAGSLPDFDRVLRRVREIEGVVNSETCLLLDRARY